MYITSELTGKNHVNSLYFNLLKTILFTTDSGGLQMLTIRKIRRISRTYRNLRRYEQIIRIIFKFGLGDLIDTLHINNFFRLGLKFFSRREVKLENHTRAERVRLAFEELGPTFIKLGQILSTRPDLISLEYLTELAKLQDNVPPFPYEEVENIVREELGGEIGDIFQSFDPTPLAAASIGQVHQAVTPAGHKVVVKVQRPGIRAIIEADLEIMNHLAEVIEHNIREAALQKPTAIVEEFARIIEKELDYIIEASHARRFAQCMKNLPDICVPAVFDELSTTRVLTLELLPGTRASAIIKNPDIGAKFNLKHVAKIGAEAVLEQIFTYGFFHADPHPGNIIVQNDNKIGFIDFGMMGHVSSRERLDFIRVLRGIIKEDENHVAQRLLKLTKYRNEPEMSQLQRDVSEIIDENLFLPLEKIELAAILEQLMRLLTKYELTLKPNLYLMIKATIIAERLARAFDPQLKIFDLLKPFSAKLQRRRLNPTNWCNDLSEPFDDLIETLTDIPSNIRILLNKAKRGNFKIEFEHRGLEPLLDTLEKSSHQISYAVILAALLIGSSLIVHANLPPLWHDVPAIGIIGFVMAGIIGFKLLLFPAHRKK